MILILFIIDQQRSILDYFSVKQRNKYKKKTFMNSWKTFSDKNIRTYRILHCKQKMAQNYRNFCEQGILVAKRKQTESCCNRFLERFSCTNQLKQFSLLQKLFRSQVNSSIPWSCLMFFLPRLNWKVGMPITLLKNTAPPPTNVSKTTILTGIGKKENMFINRILIISTVFLFDFKWLQLQMKISFAITINRAQFVKITSLN